MNSTNGDHQHTTRGPQWVRRLGVPIAMLWICGCGSGIAADLTDGNQDPTLTSALGKTSGEPNGAFSQAIAAVFSDEGVAKLQGTVSRVGDLDVYLLGARSSGDRMIVDAATNDSRLDISVAIFDAGQRLAYNNDDRGGSPDRFLDSRIDWVLRHSGERYYLVVTHAAAALSGTEIGTYTIDVRVTSGWEVPEPVGQILLLDFDGADIRSDAIGNMVLEPFDAAAISPVYQGATDTIVETIRAVFEQNFEQFDVTIRTTDDPPPVDETLVSRVYFGGFNRNAFGIADAVDLYNVDYCDDAVIFTESFQPRVFSATPTAVELGIAIGNVGSHEAGHLVGLNHVDDDRALMDDQSAADAFIDDQEFMEARLSSDIMPIGTQDAVMLLDEIVGPSAEIALR